MRSILFFHVLSPAYGHPESGPLLLPVLVICVSLLRISINLWLG